MVERTEPIRQDIDATRASMSNTLDQIEGQVRDKVDTTVSQVRRTFDLRHQISERPWVVLGAALTIGYVFGAMGDDGPPPPRPGEPMRYYTPPSPRSDEERKNSPDGQRAYNYAAEPNGGQLSGALAQLSGPIREELTMIATAAARSIVSVLRESLQESIPQFASAYTKVEREHHASDQGAAVAAGDGQPASNGGRTSGGHNEELLRANLGV